LSDRGEAQALILHADEAWIVIDKPAGLPSVPGRAPGLQDCAASRVQARFPLARVVHRLDMATSGLLLMAQGADPQRHLGEAFAQRQVDKRYLALVDGQVQADNGRIELPLAADWPQRPRQKVDPEHGKVSLTTWQVLERRRDCTRLELQPHTGRSHQLRVHLAAIGHPILGDTLYAPPQVQQRAPRLMLHAWRLALAHPVHGNLCRFESPAPF
jgi:tRNA pseudouridine32 synthase / 23S rRNA pseudouridine746 synthase